MEGGARQVLVIGERLGPIARQALPEAALQIAGPEGLDPAAADGSMFDLLIVDVEALDPGYLAANLQGLDRTAGGPAILLAASHIPMALVKAVMGLARSDVLEPPFTSTDLARAAGALFAARPAAGAGEPSSPHRSVCWTVIGSVGGCGATTIAVEIAATLARRFGKRQRSALVDLNLSGGAAAAYLGVAANMNLAEASLDPERIDPALLDAFSVKIPGGPDLLAQPRDPRAFSRIAPMAGCKILEAACQVYDWIVVDLPRHHQPWTLDVLSGADEILVISELTVPALLAARDLASEIEADLPTAVRPKIVLNRLASRMFGPAPSLGEAEKALQRKAEAAIASDWEAAAACANLGGAIGSHQPRSKIVRDIELLVDRLSARAGAPKHLNLERSA
ncbi:MAG: AAA family ATPase [Caulobacteraceae bacterium]